MTSHFGGTTWVRVRALVIARDHGLCQLQYPDVCTGRATTADHVIPRSKGGPVWDLANLRAACRPCNMARGAGRPPRPPAVSPW